MSGVYQVGFQKQFDGDDDQWEKDTLNVLAENGEEAIEKAKKGVLAEKGSYKDDETGKTVKWKITAFSLQSVNHVVDVEIE